MKHLPLSILIISLFVFLASSPSQAQSPRVEIVSKNGGQEAWLHDGRVETLLGKIEVWKKGMFLFHWGDATPEQAKAWNDAGRISPELLGYLKTQEGFSGGGFYVSTSPVDSHGYGNTLVVIELPNDIRVLKSHVTGTIDWNRLHSQLEGFHISAITVSHMESWATILDSEALTREQVADAQFFKAYHFNKIPRADMLADFEKKIPGLKNEQTYKDLVTELKQLKKDLKSTDIEKVTAATEKLISRGEQRLIEESLFEFRPKYANEETVDLVVPLLKSKSRLSSSAVQLLWKVVNNKKDLRMYTYTSILKNSEEENIRAFAIKGLEKMNVFMCSQVFRP
ncbi:MAG: hypothetical protein JSU04_12005 [Bdellovibrionales bacterium]|nr:hypothetical protein [Bdellovibrionales bacterium]